MIDEVDFLLADEHQSFLKADTVFFDGSGQACPKYPGKFAISLQYLKDEVRNILISGMCIDLLAVRIVSFIYQSKAIYK